MKRNEEERIEVSYREQVNQKEKKEERGRGRESAMKMSEESKIDTRTDRQTD